MKILFSKAKHIWKDGQRATWIKADGFNEDVFSELKPKYNTLKSSRVHFINIERMTLFLFYDKKRDFQDRSATEITALLPNMKIKNPEKVYQVISENVNNPFDDTLQYEIEIDDSDIVKSQVSKYISASLFFLLSMVGLSVYYLSGTNDKARVDEPEQQLEISSKPNPDNVVRPHTEEQNKSSSVLVAKRRPSDGDTEKKEDTKVSLGENRKQKVPVKKKIKKWQWDAFCNKHKVENPKYCYQEYIQKKCKGKFKFQYAYIEFANRGEGQCIDFEIQSFSNIKDDPDLPDLKKKEYKFFEGDKE